MTRRILWLLLSALIAISCRSQTGRQKPERSDASALGDADIANLSGQANVGDGSAEQLDPSCARCDPETKDKYDRLLATSVLIPADGGIKIFIRGAAAAPLWNDCGVHSGDLITRIAGVPADDVASAGPLLFKTCATKGEITTRSREKQDEQRVADLCRRETSRGDQWVRQCGSFHSALQASRGEKGATLFGIKPESGPARCGLRNGDVVFRLGEMDAPDPDDLGLLYDACVGTMIPLVVLRNGTQVKVGSRTNR